jgi:hypothetical protein
MREKKTGPTPSGPCAETILLRPRQSVGRILLRGSKGLRGHRGQSENVEGGGGP